MALLHAFIQRAHDRGLRHVLVITGKGASMGSDGALKRFVPMSFGKPEFRHLISSWGDRRAQPWRRRRALCPARRRREARNDHPFGEAIRKIRRERGIQPEGHGQGTERLRRLSLGTRKRQARPAGLRLPPARCRLSQHHLGRGGRSFRVAAISHPRVVVDTAGMPASYTALANRLARQIKSAASRAVRR